MKVNATIFKSENAKRKLKNMIYNIQFRRVTGNVSKRQQPDQRAGNNPWPPMISTKSLIKTIQKQDENGTTNLVKQENACIESKHKKRKLCSILNTNFFKLPLYPLLFYQYRKFCIELTFCLRYSRWKMNHYNIV